MRGVTPSESAPFTSVSMTNGNRRFTTSLSPALQALAKAALIWSSGLELALAESDGLDIVPVLKNRSLSLSMYGL